MRGPGPRDERGTRPDPNCPAHLQQGRSCCAPCGRRRERNGRGAPLGPQGYGGGGARCPLRARTDKARAREARGPQPPANPSPRCPKPGPGSAQYGAKGVPRMRNRYSQSPLEPVLVNMVPPGPEPPRGVRGRGGGGGEPPATAQAHCQPASEVGPARRSGAARKKAHAQPVGRARSARARPFLPGEEVRRCRRAGRRLLPVVRGGFGNGVSGCPNFQCLTSRLGAPRGEPESWFFRSRIPGISRDL